MQLFWLDEDLGKCARAYHDKHVNKIITEAAQMLHHAFRERGVEHELLYESTHTSHPMTKWVNESEVNMNKTFSLMTALNSEAMARFDWNGDQLAVKKTRKILKDNPSMNMSMSSGQLFEEASEPPFCADERYRVESPLYNSNLVASYRNYYLAEKIQGQKWSRLLDDLPDWLRNDLIGKDKRNEICLEASDHGMTRAYKAEAVKNGV